MADGVAISKYVNRGRLWCRQPIVDWQLGVSFCRCVAEWKWKAIENMLVDYSARSNCGRRQYFPRTGVEGVVVEDLVTRQDEAEEGREMRGRGESGGK